MHQILACLVAGQREVQHQIVAQDKPRRQFFTLQKLSCESLTIESTQSLRLTSSVTLTYNPQQIVTGRSFLPRRNLLPRLFVIGTDEHPAT